MSNTIVYENTSFGWFTLMVFNTTFNNIPVISWRSVLLVEETGGPEENHQPVTSHWQTLSHNAVHLALIEIHNISGYIVSSKSNYHTITAATAPYKWWWIDMRW
jgi:hypothetical protein